MNGIGQVHRRTYQVITIVQMFLGLEQSIGWSEGHGSLVDIRQFTRLASREDQLRQVHAGDQLDGESFDTMDLGRIARAQFAGYGRSGFQLPRGPATSARGFMRGLHGQRQTQGSRSVHHRRQALIHMNRPRPRHPGGT